MEACLVLLPIWIRVQVEIKLNQLILTMHSGDWNFTVTKFFIILSNSKFFQFLWFLIWTFSAPAATRELSEFIREVALAHDNYAKGKTHNFFPKILHQKLALCRLGKQEKSNSPHILISPIWKIVKVICSVAPSTSLEF